VLLCSPNYVNQTSLPLCVPGEPESQSLAFAKETMLWASPANAGAQVLAGEIAAASAGLTVSTAEAPGPATHMLLYLNEHTWSDERLAEQVKQARQDKLKIVMAHENDPDRGGCLFSKFFEVTPQELIADGLYKSLARSCFPGRHHPVSLALLAKDLGATPVQSGSVGRISASITKRGGQLVSPMMSSRRSAGMSSRRSAGDGSGGEAMGSRRSAGDGSGGEAMGSRRSAGDGSGGEAIVSVDSVETAVSVEAEQEHV